MLSRVADSLFWMSRYLERAEHIARRRQRQPQPHARPGAGGCRPALGPAARPACPTPPPWATRPPIDAAERATVDLANRESIAACVGAARENARQVREEISSEMWEEINRLYLDVRRPARRLPTGPPARTSSSPPTIGGVHLFQGVTDATMTHGEGWHFMELGRFLERASATAALLEVQYRECEWSADQAARRQRVRRVGRAAQVVLRLRSLLPPLHRRRAAAAHRRVPGAQRRLPALDPLRRRPHPGVAAGARRADRPGQRPRRPARRPAAARRSTTARWTRSSATCRAYLRDIVRQADADQRRRAPAVRRLSDRSGTGRMSAARHDHPLRRSATSPVHLRLAGQRERDGAAHAAGHRRRAALPAVRGRGRSRGRGCSPTATSSATGCTTSTSPRRHAQLAITARAQVQIDPPRPLPAAARRRRLERSSTAGAIAASTGTSASRATSPPGRRPLLAFVDALWAGGAPRRRSADHRARDHGRHPSAASSTRPTPRASTRPSTKRWPPAAASARTSPT